MILRRGVACAILLGGCTVSGYEDSYTIPPREVEELVAAAPRPERIARREPAGEAAEAPPAKVTLTLPGCVNLAIRSNRAFLAAYENMLLKDIDAAVAQHNYWPLLQPLTYAGSYGEYTPGLDPSQPLTLPIAPTYTSSHTVTTGVSQRFPIGGAATVGGSMNVGQTTASKTIVTGTPTASLLFPLLRGRGLTVGMEPAVAAARSRRYSEREFENLRQTLAVEIAQRYLAILQGEKGLLNLEQNLGSARRLLAESQAKFRFGRVTKTDVFRAELQVTTAENELSVTRENLKIQRDQLKTEIGLDPSTEIVLRAEEIALLDGEEDEKAYVAAVLSGNLLWQNTQDQFEDSKRLLVVAHDATRVQADLSASYSRGYEAADPFKDVVRGAENWLLGLTVNIPLDRMSIDRDYQHAVVRYVQSERHFRLSRDVLVRQSRERLIGLRQAALTVRLQKAAWDQADKGLRLLTVEYRNGKVTNRDVIEAQNNLLRSQNQYLQALVSYKTALLNVRQHTGRMKIDEEGAWLR